MAIAGFGTWAQYQGMATGFAYLSAGLVLIFYPRWYMSLYGFIVGLVILALEWPLSGMQNLMGTFFNNLAYRTLLYACFIPGSFLATPLMEPAIFMTSTVLTYGVAIYKGEKHGASTRKQIGTSGK